MSIGSVWSRNSRTRPAPSTRAASSGSCGSDWSPARTIRKISGVHSHTSTTTTAMKALVLCASTSGGLAPKSWKSGSVDADAGVVDQPPHDADDDRRDRHRQDQPDPDRAAEADLARDEQGQAEAEQRLDRDRATTYLAVVTIAWRKNSSCQTLR